jgi:O-antigen/teichoic acid export membrane protein
VVVHTLTQAEYGIAATFGITVAIITSATSFSVEALLIQDRQGSDPKLQRAVQLVVFAQGAVQAMLLFLLAPFLASLFNTPQVEWVFRWLAVIPLLRGLLHQDPTRYLRQMKYKPNVWATLIPEVASLIVVCIAAPIIQDYRLLVLALTTVPITALVVTHLSAERPYGWQSDRESIRRILVFGWPLLLNGLLMLLVSQGDRFLIGSAESLSIFASDWLGMTANAIHAYDKVDLALYSIAISLTFMPQIFASRTIPTLFLPGLSSLRDDPERHAQLFGSCLRFLSVLGTALAVGFLLSGTTLTVLIYSDRYAGVSPFIGWLGVATGIRILRMGPVVGAFSKGDTKIPLFGNIGRSFAVIGFLIVTLQALPLVWISRCLVLGEVLAVVVTLLALRMRHRVSLRSALQPILFMAVWTLTASRIAASGMLEGHAQTLGVTLLVELILLATAVATLLPVRTLKELAQTTAEP